MLRQCDRLFLFLLLLLWGVAAHAITSLNEDEFDLSERAWLSSHQELVIGMPMMGDPPYSYKDADQRFCSPPPKMKKTCGENEKLPTRLFINLGGTGITEFDNPVKPALNLYLIGR